MSLASWRREYIEGQRHAAVQVNSVLSQRHFVDVSVFQSFNKLVCPLLFMLSMVSSFGQRSKAARLCRILVVGLKSRQRRYHKQNYRKAHKR